MTKRRGWTKAEEREWFEAVGEIEHCVRCDRYGTQVAHDNQHRGIGQKSPPWMTAALCEPCHYEIDNGKWHTQEERRAMHNEAVNKTHIILIQRGTMPGTRARTER